MDRIADCFVKWALLLAAGATAAACGGGSSASAERTLAAAESPQEKALHRRAKRIRAGEQTQPPARALVESRTPTQTKTQTLPQTGTQPAVAAENAPRWKPAIGDTWHLQLTGTPEPGHAVAIYQLDLFDTPQATVDSLHAAGRRVICYFSAGSSEDWRQDFSMLTPNDMGRSLSGWPGERWLDTRSENVRRIMKLRLDLAHGKGCDGVDPDNVDGHTNDSGFPLDSATQADFNRLLAREAHARGLAIGLKNDVAQLAELEPDFDFAVNEQCSQYNECDGYSAFTSNRKPVLNVEYAAEYRDNVGGARDALCAASRAANIYTLVLPLQLDGSFRQTCD